MTEDKAKNNPQMIQLSGFKPRQLDPSIFDFDFFQMARPQGKDLFRRLDYAQEWIKKQYKTGMWNYNKIMLTPPKTQVLAMDDNNNLIYGINFASADYLGLAQNQFATEAAINAARQFGCNSAGSPLAFGGTKYYKQLMNQLGQFWRMQHVIIYSAGWLAGYGIFKGLLRDYDFVIMDNYSHNCLQEGAYATTKNVIKFKHLDNKAMEAKLKETREKNPDAGILCVTEGLFSMDSDTPDLNQFQKITKKYGAFMLIDCAHDFGCMGPGGRGTWQSQNLQDKSNVLLFGTGSKCLSTNIGFIASDCYAAIEYLKYMSPSYMFTNAINPVQAATSLANLRILNSEHGNQLRRKVLENYKYLRSQLQKRGHFVYGQCSPILPLKIGNQIVSRLVSRIMMDQGIHVNGIQFPVVSLGQARLRVNLMPQHTKAQLDRFVEVFQASLKIAQQTLEKYLKEENQKTTKPKL